MSHGGNGGIIEALYYGVPMIGIPLFCDQHRNVDSLMSKGILIRISLNDLMQTTLDAALESLLNNPTYKFAFVFIFYSAKNYFLINFFIFRYNAKFYSKIFRDQPMSLSGKTVYWIEYAIRNGGDALRSPALEFNWWQLQLLDIYAFVLAVSTSLLLIIILVIKLFVKKFIFKPSNKESKKKKKKKIN